MRIGKKVLSMFLALVMTFGILGGAFSSFVFAAENGSQTTVHIRKLKLDEEKGPVEHDLSKLEDGDLKTALTINKVEGLAGVTFSYVKIDNEEDWKKVNAQKPESLADLNALQGISKTDYTETAITVTDNEGNTTVSLPDGYYWFFEQKRPTSVTQAIAVPFGLTLPYQNLEGVAANGEKDPNSHAGTVKMTDIYVYPKNVTSKDKIDKAFGQVEDKSALDSKMLADWQAQYGTDYTKYKDDKAKVDARIGSNVDFETKTTFNQGKIFEHISWSDIMTNGLEYVDGSLTVTVTKTGTPDFDQNADLTITSQGTYGFDVQDKGDFVTEKLNKWLKQGDVEFTFKYKAKVTDLNVVDNPESNNFTFNPNIPNHNDHTTTPTDETITVEKTWADGNVPNDVLITYNLIDKTDAQNHQVVATVTLDSKNNIKSQSVDNGITIETLDNYKVKFKGLDNSHQYSVEEFADGYAPEYTSGNAITNKLSPDSLHPTPPQIVTGGKKFVKTNLQGDERLLGAKFYITNEAKNKYLAITTGSQAVTEYTQAEVEYNAAIDAYNKLSATEQKGAQGTQAKQEIASKKEDRDAKFIKARANYEWKDMGGNFSVATKTDAVVLTSDAEGRFEITGLAYGTYKLVEFVAPAGYALNTSDITFTVDATSYTAGSGDISYDLEGQTNDPGTNDAQKVVNKKVTIPPTGGIGTVIFTVLGITIMGAAVLAMKKREAAEAK